MSSAYYPLGMRNSMPASGYNHKSTLYNQMYIPWKGVGRNSFPVGTAPGHIRPLTNKDPGNVFQTGPGLPRPIKHYRKGRVVPPDPLTGIPNLIGTDPYNKNTELTINENALINYNINRFVKSSKPTPLGGSRSSSGLLNDMMGMPGGYIVKLNPDNEVDGVSQQISDCKTCEGIGIVASYKPNLNNLEENPEKNTTNSILCCNDEYKAKRRVIYANTFLKKNYYTTTKQYLQNRCKSIEQKAFNFLVNKQVPNNTYLDNPYYLYYNDNNYKPGSPLSQTNTYIANCQLNAQLYEGSENAIITQLLSIMENENIFTQAEVNAFYKLNINSIQGFWNWLNGLPESQKVPALTIFSNYLSNPYWGMPIAGPSFQTGCQLVVYKPNNYQYAKQGAVQSSTRILKLMVDTISTNAASINNYNNTGANLVSANELYSGDDNNYLNIQKNKALPCNTPWPLNMSQSRQYQNKKFCYYNQLPSYQNPASKPFSTRYYPGTVFSSNHFNQSPGTYLNTTGTSSRQQVKN
jgi:hypothetical protein